MLSDKIKCFNLFNGHQCWVALCNLLLFETIRPKRTDQQPPHVGNNMVPKRTDEKPKFLTIKIIITYMYIALLEYIVIHVEYKIKCLIYFRVNNVRRP